MEDVRLAEVLVALSLTTDLAAGMTFEKGLRTCVVATVFARDVLACDRETCRVVYETALLRSVGCTSFAPELAAIFGDEVAFQSALKYLDPGLDVPLTEQLLRLGDWTREKAQRLTDTLTEVLPTAGVEAMRNGCEASQALGSGLGVLPQTLAALNDVYERWDGQGIPLGTAGEHLSFAARVVHVAEQAVLSHARGGEPAAISEVVRRAGGHLDPELARAFAADAPKVLAPLGEPDAVASAVAAEPPPYVTLSAEEVPGLCAVLGRFVDLKSRWLVGHSEHVARLAESAGRLGGLAADEVTRLRCAALLHDLGRAGISTDVWDRPGPLSTADTERVRMHTYWTQRVLERVPALAPLAPIAAAHHERLDGSGYHRGDFGTATSPAARILAAADVFAALTEPRAHRDAFTVEEAVGHLTREADSGTLDRAACDLVLQAAGERPSRPRFSAGLTAREVEVLRLAARGLTNQQIGAELFISSRTVGHHLGHIYDKTGRRTRAGVAIFAMEQQLLP
ncbi:HD domain-containing phosphohydrolase [Streptosporangium amethystogenes]|uniref:HD domain-containing phosphohydrolase n=1 Tax=Streptosporangium amethystogenes TaxID=2002 RepID=UPI0004CAE8FA|nr:HD domain-containing phosphohydrolase [Streptosporangium amethystogenes]